MKLVEQTLLVFRTGSTEKVYEIDLCEVGSDRFVVNFRYGRRGKTLKDGTRTVAPVSEADARRIYNKLVSSKTTVGYTPGEAHVAAPAPPPVAVPPVSAAPASVAPVSAPHPQRSPDAPQVADALRQGVLNRLAAGDAPAEQRARPSMVDRMRHLAFRRPNRRVVDKRWNLNRAIWRAGQLRIQEATVLITPLVNGDPVRDHCVAFALGRCGIRSMRPIVQRLTEHRAPHVARMATAALIELTAEPDRARLCTQVASAHPELSWQYLAGDRSQVLEQVRSLPLVPPNFRELRAIYKLSEFRNDAQIHGILAHRFSMTRANFSNASWGSRVPNGSGGRTFLRGPELRAMLARDDATTAYGSNTRWYLRRRVWRTLHQLGKDGDPAYVPMAVGVLAPFTDADARDAGWGAPNFTHLWAFNHILFGAGGRLIPTKSGFRQLRAEATTREERYPALWDAQPRALLHLLAESGCTPVHAFAVRILRANQVFCSKLPISVLRMLLSRPFDGTCRFGFELAQQRYVPGGDPADLRGLGFAVAACGTAELRAVAHGWMQQTPSWYASDAPGLVALAGSEHADNRAFARRFFSTAGLQPAVRTELVGGLVALLTQLETADRAQDVADAVRLLLAEQATVPNTSVMQLLQAPSEAARVLGAGLLAHLDDDALLTQQDVIWELLTHREASLREAVAPVFVGLVDRHPAFAEKHLQMLLASLLRRKLPEGVPGFVVRLLRQHLQPHLSTIPTAIVWRLVRSKEGAAQELGGVLLPDHLDPDAVEIPELVELASHPILALRQVCWQLFPRMVPRIQAEMASAVQLLDASWEDSRLFGFRFFEELSKDSFTPDVLVSICDSVRPDVQAYGRRLITRHFEDAHGEQYLLQLSEHPAGDVQLFASSYLERYAAGQLANLERLEPYFQRVLCAVNRGRAARQRTHSFLRQEALRDASFAAVVGRIVARHSATDAIEDRAQCLLTLTAIQRAWPEVSVPLQRIETELR